MRQDVSDALLELSSTARELKSRADRFGRVPVLESGLWRLIELGEALEAVPAGLAELGTLGDPDGEGQVPVYPYRARAWRIRTARFVREVCQVKVFGVAVPVCHRTRKWP